MKIWNTIILLFVAAAACLAADDVVLKAEPERGQLGPLQLFIVPTVMGIFAMLRAYSHKIPPAVIVIGAPILGGVLDALGTQAGIWDSSGALGALLGANAVWLHQLGKQTWATPKS